MKSAGANNQLRWDERWDRMGSLKAIQNLSGTRKRADLILDRLPELGQKSISGCVFGGDPCRETPGGKGNFGLMGVLARCSSSRWIPEGRSPELQAI